MTYSRPLFATFALLYCVCLGAVSLYKSRGSKVHRLFALYNFSLAFYNADDYAVFAPNEHVALWIVRAAGAGATFMIYFILHFNYSIASIAETPAGKKILKGAKWAAFLVAFVYIFTPFMIRGVNYSPDRTFHAPEMVGPLYWLFGVWAVAGLLAAVIPLLLVRKKYSEFRRKQINYLLLGCGVGIAALSVYFLSLVWRDLPWIYFPLEALVCFIFSYAIFQHNLIPASVGLRRALLVMGIYITLAMILVPATLLTHTTLTQGGPMPLLIWMSASGLLFSLGPVLYGAAVRRLSLFQDQTISHITHELKTPLHAIQSAKEILAEETAAARPDPGKIRDYLDLIQRNSERLENFVLDILNYSKADAPGSQSMRSQVDLVALCRQVCRQYPQQEPRIRCEGENSVLVRGVEEGLRQTLTNLLSNALNADPQGEIVIRIQKNQNNAHVSIQDQGPGLSKENITKIFTPFVQAGDAATQKKGTGLGLVIAKRWVEAHEGKIWAESDGVGRGATFRFVLPLG